MDKAETDASETDEATQDKETVGIVVYRPLKENNNFLNIYGHFKVHITCADGNMPIYMMMTEIGTC